MIRVAVADDSAFTCRLLASYLDGTAGCQVVGVAHDAASTLALVDRERPDVLTLDMEMPGACGLELLRRVAGSTAVVVISGVTRRAAATTLRALDLGAIDFVLKYTPGAPSSPESLRREIVAKVTTAAAARTGRAITARVLAHDAMPAATMATSRRVSRDGPAPRQPAAAIVIGASTGGPQALRKVLAALPRSFTVPCVIVQHLPPSFTAAFATELARYGRLPVEQVRHGTQLAPGRMFLAPGGTHVIVRAGGRLELRPATERDPYRPSIDLAMLSAADSCGAGAVGVVLSGMGSDGAEGLKHIRESGGRTYVQDVATCVIGSMPARALARAGADYVGSPERIGSMLAGEWGVS